MERPVLVYTTYPSLVEAERAGRNLVESGLAACVNILPGMVSIYRWQGRIERADEVPLGELRLRVIRRVDLLHEKLRAASDPARRRSKRLQDLADAQALIESTPVLASELTAEERALLGRLPA